MTTPAIKYLDEGSPIAAFTAWLRGLHACNRTLPADWHPLDYSLSFRQDVQMLLEEGVTYGLRTQWLRRVAVPLVMAQKELEKIGTDEAAALAHAKTAVDIISQLQEGAVKAKCLAWIRSKWHVDPV